MTGKLERWILHVSFCNDWRLCRPYRMIGKVMTPSLLSGSVCDTITLPCPAGLCIMIAASIYTAKLHTSEAEGGYGHSYVLAWISFVLTFLLAITYLVLRKKSEWRYKDEGEPGIMFPVWIWVAKTRICFKIWELKNANEPFVFILNIINWNWNMLALHEELTWTSRMGNSMMVVIGRVNVITV